MESSELADKPTGRPVITRHDNKRKKNRSSVIELQNTETEQASRMSALSLIHRFFSFSLVTVYHALGGFFDLSSAGICEQFQKI